MFPVFLRRAEEDHPVTIRVEDSYWNNIWNNKKVTTGDPPFYENPLWKSQNSSESSIFLLVFTCDLWIYLVHHPPITSIPIIPMITPWQSKKKTKASQVKFKSPVTSTSAGDAASMLLRRCFHWTINGNHHETGRFKLPPQEATKFWIQSSVFGEPYFFRNISNHPQMSNPHLEVVHQRLLRRCHHRRSAMKKSRRLGGFLGDTTPAPPVVDSEKCHPPAPRRP